MNRLFSLILVFCICLSFAACATPDIDDFFDTGPAEGHGETVQYQGTYPYGNMQKNRPSGNFMLLDNEVVFAHIFDGKSLLYSCDLTTGEVTLYCKDATCKHDTCVAGSLFANLEVYEGKLYGLNQNGTGFNQLSVAEGDTVKTITNSGGSFFHHADKLYIKTADSSFMVLEEGEKEPQMLLEEHTGYWHTIFGNYLYATTNSDIIRVDLTAEDPKEEVVVPNAGGMTDGEHIYYIDLQTSYLYRCAIDGSNPELLVEQPVLLASINFDDEYFYYRLFTDQKIFGNPDSCDIYRFPKDNPAQIEKIVTLPVSATQVFTVPGTGKIFVNTYAPERDDSPLYVMNADGSDPKILEMPEY